MSLILRLRSAAVNWPTRGIFEQSALKIRATARKWIVLRSLSDAGRLGSKLQRHKREAARLFEVAPAQMRPFYALMVAAKEGGVRSRDKERIVPAIAIAMRWEGCVFHQVEAARLTERSAKKRSSHHVWRISADADLSYWDGSCPRIRPVRTQIVSLHLFAQMVPRLVHAQGASAFWRRRG